MKEFLKPEPESIIVYRMALSTIQLTKYSDFENDNYKNCLKYVIKIIDDLNIPRVRVGIVKIVRMLNDTGKKS